MPHRSSVPSSAPRALRRAGPSRIAGGLLAGALTLSAVPGDVRGEILPGDLLAGAAFRVDPGAEVAQRTAKRAPRGLPVLRDLLEAPPRIAVLVDVPEAPAIRPDGPLRAPVAAVAPVEPFRAPVAAMVATLPAYSDPTFPMNTMPVWRSAAAAAVALAPVAVAPVAVAVPVAAPVPGDRVEAGDDDLLIPVLFAAAAQPVSDAPRSATVIAQGPTPPAARGASRPQAAVPAAATPVAATPVPVAQAAPAPAAPKAPVRAGRGVPAGVPTLTDLAGRAVVDLKDELGAAASFERIGTAGLTESITRALSSSFEVAANTSRTRAQRELIDVARGGLLPKLDLRANTGREESKPGSVIDEATGAPVLRSLHTRDDTALVLRQSIFDGAAIGEWSRQKSLYQAAVAGLGSARDQLALDAGGAHLDLLQYRLALQFARDYRIGLEQLYQYVERRSQGGGASAAEAERVKARAINARSTVIEAQGALESALVSYRRLTGSVPEALRTDDLAGIRDLPDLESALTQARGTNPQIIQLKQTLASVEAEERSALGKLYPKLEIEVGNYRTANAGGRPGLTDDTRAMLVLNWNLLSGGADVAQLRSVRARQDETKFRILDLERRLEEALRVTYNTLDAVTQRASAVREEMISNERVVSAFQEQLVLANRPLLDVLDAQQRLYQSRNELLRLTALQASLALQVRRQLGGLAPEGAGYKEPPPTVSSSIPSLPTAR